MDGERKACTERILNAIEYGKLPNDETERRLSALIEAEVNKTDSAADMELIDACQSLLWQLHTHGEVSYESHYEQNWAQITKRLNRKARMARNAKSAGRMLAAAAAVVLVVWGVSGNLKWNWLEHDDTPDQQQHIIAGNEIGVELVQSAIAEYSALGGIRVNSPEELADHICFVPMPQTIDNAWSFSVADVSINPFFISVDAQYQSLETNSYLLYSVFVFANADDAYFTFEQSEIGQSDEVDGHPVYVTNNINRATIVWTDGLVFVRLSGDFTEQDGLTIMSHLLKEWY